MMAAAAGTLLRGRERLAEPLARHTSWRVGGPARRYYEPADLADLCAFLASLPADEPVFWLGLGSNLLVRDGGIAATVIALAGALDRLQEPEPGVVEAEAGVPCAKVAKAAGRAGLTGAEFFAGIPGTMGGALAMNAGAFGGETWGVVESVQTMDRRGALRWRPPTDYVVGYRSVQGPPGEWFTAARLRFVPGSGEAAGARVRALLRRRSETQPTGVPSGGSVFRNPPGDHAARLIEQCGLKGRRRGGAVVSEKHANFIVNAGGATAADIEGLMVEVQAVVARVTGVALAPEVQLVGSAREEHTHD